MRVVSALISLPLPISFTLTFGYLFYLLFFSSDIEKEKYDREMLFSFGPSCKQKFLSYKLEEKNGLEEEMACVFILWVRISIRCIAGACRATEIFVKNWKSGYSTSKVSMILVNTL